MLMASDGVPRKSPALNENEDSYARSEEDTERFSDYFGRVESIVTSSANNDSGLFETNLRDERYLPFEGAGAVSTWRLELPSVVKQFDHDTISDIILHLRYTAREGGVPLRIAAETHLAANIAAAATVGSVRLLSVRHDFPTEWARFAAVPLSGSGDVAPLTITLREEHYPIWVGTVKPGPIAIRQVDLYAKAGKRNTVTIYDDPAAAQKKVDLAPDNALNGLLYGRLSHSPAQQNMPAATGALTWYVSDNTMHDFWIALTWGAKE